jgi:hypothetical protein
MARLHNLEKTVKIKLAQLIDQLQPIINKHIDGLSLDEINFILQHYRKYLKVDLERDLESARTKQLTTSPFDGILNDFQTDNEKS